MSEQKKGQSQKQTPPPPPPPAKTENRMYGPGYRNVRFGMSPTGVYGLSYHAGEIGAVKSETAKKIVDAGHGEFVD